MKTYSILIKDVYTENKRSETIECSEATDVRDIHKQAMKGINVAEDINVLRAKINWCIVSNKAFYHE